MPCCFIILVYCKCWRPQIFKFLRNRFSICYPIPLRLACDLCTNSYEIEDLGNEIVAPSYASSTFVDHKVMFGVVGRKGIIWPCWNGHSALQLMKQVPKDLQLHIPPLDTRKSRLEGDPAERDGDWVIESLPLILLKDGSLVRSLLISLLLSLSHTLSPSIIIFLVLSISLIHPPPLPCADLIHTLLF